MSQDNCEFYFSTVDSDITPQKMSKKILRIFEKSNISIINSGYGYQGNRKRNRVVQIEAKNMDDVLLPSLKLLDALPKDHSPYISYYSDQAGEFTYLCLAGKDLVSFADKNEIEEYLDSQQSESPEKVFFSTLDNDPFVMLLRLQTTNNRFAGQLVDICNEYIKEPSEESFSNVESFLDKSTEEETFLFNTYDDNNVCDINIVKSLCFTMAQGRFIFLGFNSPEIQHSAYRQHVADSDAILLMRDFRSIKPIKACKAKIWSTKKKTNLEWYIYDIGGFFMCFDDNRSPVNLWAG